MTCKSCLETILDRAKPVIALLGTLALGYSGFAQDIDVSAESAKVFGTARLKKTVSSAVMDYTVASIESTKDNIEHPIRVRIKSNGRNINDKNICAVYLHGLGASADDWDAFDNASRFCNKEPEISLKFTYSSIAKDPMENADIIYNELTKTRSKYASDLENCVSVFLGHSLGGVTLTLLLQNHPDIISSYNMLCAVTLGAPLNGSSDLMQAIPAPVLRKLIKPWDEFQAVNNLTIEQISSGILPCVPMMFISGLITKTEGQGLFYGVNMMLLHDSDGVVEVDRTKPSDSGMFLADDGGVNVRKIMPYNHSDLYSDPKAIRDVTQAINNYTMFLANLPNDFDSTNIVRESDNSVVVNHTRIQFGNDYVLRFFRIDDTFDSIRKDLVKDISLKSRIDEIMASNYAKKGIKTLPEIRSTKLEIDNYFGLAPKIIIEDKKGFRYFVTVSDPKRPLYNIQEAGK